MIKQEMNNDKIICHIGNLSECDNTIKITSDINASIGTGYLYINEDQDSSMAASEFLKIVEANKNNDFAIDLSTNIYVMSFFIEYLIKITLSKKYSEYINSLTICVNSIDDAKTIDSWQKRIMKNTQDRDEWWNLK